MNTYPYKRVTTYNHSEQPQVVKVDQCSFNYQLPTVFILVITSIAAFENASNGPGLSLGLHHDQLEACDHPD